MNAADKIATATQRLRATRASIEQLPSSEAKAHAMIQPPRIMRKAKDNETSTKTVRLLNHDCDELNHDGVSYKPDPSGAFNVPESVAATVVRQPGGFYRGPAAAYAAAKLPFNPVFNVSGGVTIANDVAGRLLILELAHAARLGLDNVPFTDSAGNHTVLSTAECRALSGEYRTRLLATL
jgi:hypothetical protein